MNANGHERWADELAPYALDALDAGEAREVEAHLAGCERCRAELRWLEPAVDVLAESVAQVSPPPGLRAALLEVTRAEARDAGLAAPRRGWRDWALRPSTALAAAAVAAAGVAGYALRGAEGDDRAATLEATAPAGNATAVLERDGDSGTLELANLPQVEGGGVYQLWLASGDEVRASVAVRPGADGTATARIRSGLDEADAVMVTPEPEAGLAEPTGPVILAATLE